MNRRRAVTTAAIALALAALVVSVYAPVRHFDFVQLDDPAYVTENPHVLRGLTVDGAAWAFTTGHAANWHPVTWLSHMLDVELFGVAAGPHHLTNLLLHAVNTLLLFGVLLRMTGAFWRSALVAALFGIHPLHVESVAWVAERKDVLSTLFWLLTTWAYVAYVRTRSICATDESGGDPRIPAAGGVQSHAAGHVRPQALYVLTLGLFAFGLMAKPMLVTLPFVLLLLDWWPLGRWGLPGGCAPGASPSASTQAQQKPSKAKAKRVPARRVPAPIRAATPFLPSLRPLVREKIPFFALAAASSIVTFVVQQRGGAVSAVASEPFALRLQNALVSAVAYLRDMVWPAGLTMIYPFPSSVPAWQVVAASLVLGGVSIAAWRLARHHPYLAVGWLWYLGTLVPVLGLVRVGLQARADRYTYVPLVGVFIALAWGGAALAERMRLRFPHRTALQNIALAVLATAVVLALAGAARQQVGYWKDNVTLWTRATVLTLHMDEYEAHMSLGATLANQGRTAEALRHFTEAVRLRPDSAEARRAEYDLRSRAGGGRVPR